MEGVTLLSGIASLFTCHAIGGTAYRLLNRMRLLIIVLFRVDDFDFVIR